MLNILMYNLLVSVNKISVLLHLHVLMMNVLAKCHQHLAQRSTKFIMSLAVSVLYYDNRIHQHEKML